MPGQLGAGTNRAMIYTQGGGTELLKLDSVSALTWGRTRNAFSVAQCTVTPDDTNWGDLGDVCSWAHELVIFRDGARVWEGPIRFPDWGKGDVTFMAVDVLGWLAKRKITVSRLLGDGGESPVTTEMDLDLQHAFAVHDPNVLANRLTLHHSGEAKIGRDVAANSGMYDNDFTSMAGQGGNFTTVGRRAIIWPDEVLIGRTDTLIPERDTTADVRVQEAGDDLATRVTSVTSEGLAATVSATSTDVDLATGLSDFYGLHDRLLSEDDSVSTAGLTAISRAAVAQLFPAPVRVVMPADSVLKPTAPFRMAELVPGVLVPIETSATPRRASGTMILDSMSVSQTPDGGEQVTITLANASAYAGSAEG